MATKSKTVETAGDTQQTKKVASNGTVILRALHTIQHDGETFTAGETLETTEKQAQALLAVGAAEAVSNQ